MKPMIIPEEFWVGSPVIVTVHGHELKGQVLGIHFDHQPMPTYSVGTDNVVLQGVAMSSMKPGVKPNNKK